MGETATATEDANENANADLSQLRGRLNTEKFESCYTEAVGQIFVGVTRAGASIALQSQSD